MVVGLGDPASRAAFAKVWPPAKFPVLHVPESGLVVPESSIVIEWLAEQHSGQASLLPADDLARRHASGRFRATCRCREKIVGNRIRPADNKDPGVEEAHQKLDMAFDMTEARMAQRWAVGDGFTMADCRRAARYANGASHRAKHTNTAAYLAAAGEASFAESGEPRAMLLLGVRPTCSGQRTATVE